MEYPQAMSREFLGTLDEGPFHVYPFVLHKAGDCTVLHAHAHDHFTRGNKKIAVYSLTPSGAEALETINGFSDWRVVKAGVRHIVIALEDDCYCECLFSNFDENGRVGDPKQRGRQHYKEDTSGVPLPDLINRLLEAEGVKRG
jgi:hypothetical protein